MTNNILRFWQSFDESDPMEPLFVAAPILMHSIDKDGVLLRVSRFWADKLGYKVEDMVGRYSTEFLTAASREYARDVVLPEFYRTGKIENVEYDFVRRDGQTLPILMSGIAQYDQDGTFIRSLAIMFDNSEAKRVGLQLRQRHRAEAIGALTGGVAHDFNNLLSVIQGNLELHQQSPCDPERDDFIENALAATQRGATLVRQLLTYGRQAHLVPKVLDLNEFVRTSDRMVKRLLPANISLQTVTHAGLWKIEVDPSQLETAVLNILNNARDALPDGGRITMETCNVRVTEEYVLSREEEVEPGRYVMLAVSDTGVGIDDETLAKIFDPFFSTKAVGQGSGLGLSMVFGFMRQSKGTIRAYSEPGVGTTFRLYFPVALGYDDDRAPALSGDAPLDASERLILVVEDDEGVRSIMMRHLQNAGYKTVEAASGDDALVKIEAGLVPDVLISDIVMPGKLQGPELVERARAALDGLRVLFISGYPTEAAIHGNGVRSVDRSLVKPFSKSDLLKAVRELLVIES